MAKLIYFNGKDLIDGVGQSQKVESVEAFIDLNRSKFADVLITGNVISFTKAMSEENEPIKGYALIFDVPNDFEN